MSVDVFHIESFIPALHLARILPLIILHQFFKRLSTRMFHDRSMSSFSKYGRLRK